MKHKTAIPVPDSPTLSSTGQLIGWAVFGALVLAGFLFGVVVGYESPKPVVVAKANSEPPRTPEPAAPTPAEPKKEQSLPAKPAPPVKKADESPPKDDPPKVDPPKIITQAAPPKKVEPKPKTLAPVSFRTDVLPILRTHCLNCHGAGTGKPKADVNLTSIASMTRSPGKILVPGKPEESDVYTSITEREMPDGGRPKPTAKELMTLRNWILTGAKERRPKRRRSPR
jgi:Planctomycete cytochrome C